MQSSNFAVRFFRLSRYTFLLLSFACAPSSVPWAQASGQTGMAAAVQGTPAPVAAPLNTAPLELNTKISSAANTLALGIVRKYKLNGGFNPSSDLDVYLLDFDTMIIGQAKVPALAPELAKSDQNSAKAQSTTGQTNTQNGAPASSGGSTSAAQKVGIPQLLGIAVENGAITNTVKGTTMTLSTTPYGFVTAFDRNQDTAKNYYDSAFTTHTGISSTFNVANTSDPLQGATRKAVQQWQVKYTFFDTSARSRRVESQYISTVYPKAELMLAAYDHLNVQEVEYLNNIRDAVVCDLGGTDSACPANPQGAWTDSLLPIIKAAEDANEYQGAGGSNTAKLATTILQLLDANKRFQSVVAEAEQDAGIAQASSAYWTAHDGAYATALAQFKTWTTNLPKGNAHGFNGDMTFGQTFPATQTSSTAASSSKTSPPAYLLGELDLAFSPPTELAKKYPGIPSLTGNFISSFYSDPNPTLNENTFRGGKFAAMSQWDLPQGPFSKLMAANNKSKMTVALTGSYERLQENEGQKGKKADIVLGNVKFAIPLPGGVSFPFSVSFANASSQVKGNYVVGNFGLTFSLDSLTALLKANP